MDQRFCSSKIFVCGIKLHNEDIIYVWFVKPSCWFQKGESKRGLSVDTFKISIFQLQKGKYSIILFMTDETKCEDRIGPTIRGLPCVYKKI